MYDEPQWHNFKAPAVHDPVTFDVLNVPCRVLDHLLELTVCGRLWNVAEEHTSGHRALIALIALIAPMALSMGRLLLVRHADKWMRGEWPAAWAACHERRPTVNKMA